MEELRITRLDRTEDAGGELAGSWLEEPRLSSAYNLKLAGWALRPDGPPRRIRITNTEARGEPAMPHRVLAATPPNHRRPDVADRFPYVPRSELSGFRVGCSLLGLPREFSLRVVAGFEGQPAVTVSHIDGTRRALRTGYRPRFQPILLNTLARAGSTWLTQLIGAHAHVIAYRPSDFAPRMLDHWVEIVRTLSHPHAWAQTLDPDMKEPRGWLVGRGRTQGAVFRHRDPHVERWLEVESIQDLAAFAQRQVDSFYGRVAESQNKAQAPRFIERCRDWQQLVLARELYGEAREVFLVRDPRDELVSRLGLDETARPEEYVSGAMRAEVDQFVETWLARKEDAFLLRYEDLVLQPRQAVRELFAHLGLASIGETAGADDPNSLGRWRTGLTPSLQTTCAEAFAGALTAFGYEQ